MLAIMLIAGVLTACGGGGDSEAEETVPDVPTSEPDSSVLPADTQPVRSEESQEANEPPVEATSPVTTAFESLYEELESDQEFGESLGPALADFSEVVEEMLSQDNGIEPADIVVVVSDGEIVEGDTRYEIAMGESISIEVFSSKFDREVHVHGYDLTDFAGPITPARFEFDADLAGTWEVEFEANHELIFELVVR